MKSYRFYTVPKVLDKETLAQVVEIARGYTVYETSGGWIDDDGKLYEEPGAVLEVWLEYRQLADTVLLLRANARLAGEQTIGIVWPDGEATIEKVRDDANS